MQLAKVVIVSALVLAVCTEELPEGKGFVVVITSALVLATCAEGLPEGKGFVLKCIQDVKSLQTVACILKLFAV